MNARFSVASHVLLALAALLTAGFDEPRSVLLLVPETWAQPHERWVSTSTRTTIRSNQQGFFWQHPSAGVVAFVVREFISEPARGRTMRELYVSRSPKHATKLFAWEGPPDGVLTAAINSNGALVVESDAKRIEIGWRADTHRFEVVSQPKPAPIAPVEVVAESTSCKVLTIDHQPGSASTSQPTFENCSGVVRISGAQGGDERVELCLLGEDECSGADVSIAQVRATEITGDGHDDYVLQGSYLDGMCQVDYFAVIARVTDSYHLAFRANTKAFCDEDAEARDELPVEIVPQKTGRPPLLRQGKHSYQWNPTLLVFLESSNGLRERALRRLGAGDYSGARAIAEQGKSGYPQDFARFAAILSKVDRAEASDKRRREFEEQKRQAARERERVKLARVRQLAREKILAQLNAFVAVAGPRMNRALRLCMAQDRCAYAPLAAFGFGCPGCGGGYEDALRRADEGATLQNVIDIARALHPLATREVLGIALGDAEAIRDMVNQL